jgi:phosphoglycerate dehydrogenase-like enzyme
MRVKVYIGQPIEPEGIAILSRSCEVVAPPPGTLHDRAQFLKALAGCDAIVAWQADTLDREALAAAPRLKVIGRYGVGYDNLDLPAATERGIYCTFTPVHTEAVADLSFLLLMSVARKVCLADAYVRGRHWVSGGRHVARRFQGTNVFGKTIGIIGAGRIGAGVARRASGFGMSVLYFDAEAKPELEKGIGARRADLPGLLAEADFVSINCALTDATRGLIGRAELALMKPGAILANTARGPIVDQAALAEALVEGRIGGAGLDVYASEPLPLDSPLIGLENVVLTPHIAPSTSETWRLMSVTVANDIVAVLAGRAPQFLLNPEVRAVRTLTGSAA